MRGTCTRTPCEYWHPPSVNFTKQKRAAKQETSVFPHYKVEEQPSKKPKKELELSKAEKVTTKEAVAFVKTVPQLDCVSQDSEPSESLKSVVSRRNPKRKVLGSTRRVRFTQSTLRQAIVKENKRIIAWKIHVKIPHQRSPYAMKFEDRSQEETERQERCARGKAWNLAKHIYKLKEEDKATISIRLQMNGFCWPHPP